MYTYIYLCVCVLPRSQDWSCPDCGKIADLLGTESTENVPTTNEENVGTVNDTPLQVMNFIIWVYVILKFISIIKGKNQQI